MWSATVTVQVVLAVIVLFKTNQSTAWHRDYVYDIAAANPVDYIDRTAEAAEAVQGIKYSNTRIVSKCVGTELPYIILDLEACDVSSGKGAGGTCPNKISLNPPIDEVEAAKIEAYKLLVKLAKDSKEYHTRFWPNIITIIVKCLPIPYFIYLVIFTGHFNYKNTNNPRMLDGTSTQGQREWVYLRPKFHLWDGSVTPHRMVGLVQRQVVWRDDIEAAKDWELSNRPEENINSPKLGPGQNFHVMAKTGIPELDENELTEAQALKRRVRRYGAMTRDELRFHVEHIHFRRVVFTASEDYYRRFNERGNDPSFDRIKEAKKSMKNALHAARQEKIANIRRIDAARKNRDKIINIQLEKANKSFKHHHQRMIEHQEMVDQKMAKQISDEESV